MGSQKTPVNPEKPSTTNLEQPGAGYDLDFVTGSARNMPVNTVLVNARGFGGFNSAVVLRKFSG